MKHGQAIFLLIAAIALGIVMLSSNSLLPYLVLSAGGQSGCNPGAACSIGEGQKARYGICSSRGTCEQNYGLCGDGHRDIGEACDGPRSCLVGETCDLMCQCILANQECTEAKDADCVGKNAGSACQTDKGVDAMCINAPDCACIPMPIVTCGNGVVDTDRGFFKPEECDPPGSQCEPKGKGFCNGQCYCEGIGGKREL